MLFVVGYDADSSAAKGRHTAPHSAVCPFPSTAAARDIHALLLVCSLSYAMPCFCFLFFSLPTKFLLVSLVGLFFFSLVSLCRVFSPLARFQPVHRSWESDSPLSLFRGSLCFIVARFTMGGSISIRSGLGPGANFIKQFQLDNRVRTCVLHVCVLGFL